MPYVPSSRGWRERVAAVAEQPAPVTAEETSAPAPKPPRRPRWRLRILGGLNAFLAILYAVNQLDPSAVKKLGPAGDYVFDLLHPPAGAETWDPAGRRLRAEVKAMGGVARVNETSRRFLGFWSTIQRFDVRIDQSGFGDDALASLVRKYGDRIQALDLRRTGVTNEGLRHLEGLSQSL